MAVDKGNKVKVLYEGRLESGEVFDKSSDDQPLEFTAGGGQVIPGFDDAVMGMDEGEEKEFSVPPADAYGDRKDDLIVEVSRSRLPDDVEPEKGMLLRTQDPNSGRQQVVTVTDVGDENIKVDLNHPLAGKKLVFKITVVGIQ